MRRALPFVALLAIGCGAGGPVPPAAKPRRPPQKPVEPVASSADCPKVVPEQLPASVPYEQRSRSEAANVAAAAGKLLADGLKPGQPPAEMERLVTDAVAQFIVALKADPYNVSAHYSLAGAYARIGRKQCSVNLLERLALLRKLPSFTPEIEGKVDKLLGRNAFRGAVDHDFDAIRADDAFREVVKQLTVPL
jgi:hypothetical protein